MNLIPCDKGRWIQSGLMDRSSLDVSPVSSGWNNLYFELIVLYLVLYCIVNNLITFPLHHSLERLERNYYTLT